MSDDKGNHRSTAAPGDREVLVNLPHTRPQRSSPRRAAAREAAEGTGATRRAPVRPAARSRIGGGTATQGGPRKPTRAPSGKRARSAAKRPAGSAPRRDAAPRQGFESENENMNSSVQPPGGAELVVSAAEIVGELAKVGLSAGERLLKDAFSRLPRS